MTSVQTLPHSGFAEERRASQMTIPASLPDACYVRALYSFSSDEPSSLTFHSGDLIRVLTKLESGWWDGLLRGQRGWFPSNYVEEVEILDSDDEADQVSSEEDVHDYAHNAERTDHLRNNSDTIASLIEPVQGIDILYNEDSKSADSDLDDAAFWIPQVTSEGRMYYFNTKNGTASWDLPMSSLSSVLQSKTIADRVLPFTSGIRPPMENGSEEQLSKMSEETSSEYQSINKPNYLHASGWSDVHDRSLFSEESPEVYEDDCEILLFAAPNRGAANMENHAQDSYVQNADNFEASHQTAAEQAAHDSRALDLIATATSVDLSTNLRHWETSLNGALVALSRAVADRKQTEYHHPCETLKNVVREILQSLSMTDGDLDQETTTILGDKPATNGVSISWKNEYRQMLAAVSKLILSSHVASNDWVMDEAAPRMLEDATDLVALTNNFMSHVQDASMTITLLRPVAVEKFEAGGWTSNGVYNKLNLDITAPVPSVNLSTNTIITLENLVLALQTNVKSCRSKIKQLDTSTNAGNEEAILQDTLIITQDLKRLLHYCEQLNLRSLEVPSNPSTGRSPTIDDFAKSKQLLYDSAGSLVLASQGLSRAHYNDANAPFRAEAVLSLIDSFNTMETAMQSTVLHAEFLLQELFNRDTQSTGMKNDHEPEGITTNDKSRRIVDNLALESNAPAPQMIVSRPPLLTSKSQMQGLPPKTNTPWFLDHEHEADLSYDSKGNVKAGTLLALVELLTRHDLLDSNYNNTFLLTYRSFTTAEELTTLLMKRFSIDPPTGLTTSQFSTWVDIKQNPIRLRVFNIFKSWMESFFVEPPIETTYNWLARLKTFVEDVMSQHVGSAQSLVKLINMRVQHGDGPWRKLIQNSTVLPPPSILPRGGRKVRLLDIDPLEVARQLTIIESEMYNKIKPTECLDKSWSKPDAAEGAENIKAMILRSNRITAWVAEAILFQTDLKKRVSLIKHFISIAEKCRSLNNFSTLTAIISGLNSAPVHRLRRTWDLLNARVAMCAEDLNRLMNSSKNFSAYRDTLHQMQPPCVPFLGVYLTDLTFIEDGNPNMSVKARHLINISKRQKTADVIRDIQQYQVVPYALNVVPEVQDYIAKCMIITRDISELYEVSLEREPREREDEKIARLLQESGFL